ASSSGDCSKKPARRMAVAGRAACGNPPPALPVNSNQKVALHADPAHAPATRRCSMNDRIEKRIVLKAPVSRVWRALTDHEQFGAWFQVKLEAPFVPGKEAVGKITHPGCEHVTWRAVVR